MESAAAVLMVELNEDADGALTSVSDSASQSPKQLLKLKVPEDDMSSSSVTDVVVAPSGGAEVEGDADGDLEDAQGEDDEDADGGVTEGGDRGSPTEAPKKASRTLSHLGISATKPTNPSWVKLEDEPIAT